MTQKNKTILVGVLALAVWIYAGKEWLGYLGTNEQVDSAEIKFSNTLPSKLYLTSEKYTPSYEYQDPFLSSFHNYSSVSNVSNYQENENNLSIKNQTPESKKVNPSVEMEIKYQGLISSDKEILGLLTINNKSHVVSKGDFVDEIKVLNITKDEIVVVLNGIQLSVKK